MIDPKRSEIWLVDLNPTKGQEIQKTRPAVVISRNTFRSIPIQIVVPVTTWQPKFDTRPFMVRMAATEENGLDRDSAGNVLQVRCVSIERFINRLGKVLPDVMGEIVAGLMICIDE